MLGKFEGEASSCLASFQTCCQKYIDSCLELIEPSKILWELLFNTSSQFWQIMNENSKLGDKRNETLEIEELNWSSEMVDQTRENPSQSSRFENISMIKGQKDSLHRQLEKEGALFIENDNILKELCTKRNSEKRSLGLRPASGQYEKIKALIEEPCNRSSSKNISSQKDRTKSFSSTRELAIVTTSNQKTIPKSKPTMTPKTDTHNTCANHFFMRKDLDTNKHNPSPTSQDHRQSSTEVKGEERTTNFFMETKKKRINDSKSKIDNIMEANIEQISSVYMPKTQIALGIKKPTIKMLYESASSGIGQKIADRNKEKTLSNKGSTATSRHNSKEIRGELGATMPESHRRTDSRADLSSKKINMNHPSYLDARNSPHLSAFKQKHSVKADDYSDYKGFSEIIKAKEEMIESLQRQLTLRTTQHEVG